MRVNSSAARNARSAKPRAIQPQIPMHSPPQRGQSPQPRQLESTSQLRNSPKTGEQVTAPQRSSLYTRVLRARAHVRGHTQAGIAFTVAKTLPRLGSKPAPARLRASPLSSFQRPESVLCSRLSALMSTTPLAESAPARSRLAPSRDGLRDHQSLVGSVRDGAVTDRLVHSRSLTAFARRLRARFGTRGWPLRAR
jgi:hypothetical protein